MGFKFNPLTGKLDLIDSSTASSTVFARDNKVVDAPFLLDKKITLTGTPVAQGELVFLNGMLLDDTCYTIVTNELTFTPSLPFKVGHFIDIRYAAS